jgi:hypothetical protein
MHADYFWLLVIFLSIHFETRVFFNHFRTISLAPALRSSNRSHPAGATFWSCCLQNCVSPHVQPRQQVSMWTALSITHVQPHQQVSIQTSLGITLSQTAVNGFHTASAKMKLLLYAIIATLPTIAGVQANGSPQDEGAVRDGVQVIGKKDFG